MKFLFFGLIIWAVSSGAILAQEDDAPPPPMPAEEITTGCKLTPGASMNVKDVNSGIIWVYQNNSSKSYFIPSKYSDFVAFKNHLPADLTIINQLGLEVGVGIHCQTTESGK